MIIGKLGGSNRSRRSDTIVRIEAGASIRGNTVDTSKTQVI